MKKVMIVGGNPSYDKMFSKRGWELVDNISEAQLVQFTGGADVHPSFYGEEVHPNTFHNIHRDREEELLFKECLEKGIPMAGICRGGQFLNVMCGGSMYQHVDNHGRSHGMLILDRLEAIEVTSTHHQMMRPSQNARILAVASPRIATTKQHVVRGEVVCNKFSEEDIEVVLYEEQKCLCFQPHPEMFIGSMQDYYFECLEKYLGV